MTLTFKFNCACRFCGTEFDPAAPAGPIKPNNYRYPYGRISLPRVARRYLLPFVCDDCWYGLSQWMAAKELAQHRKDAQKHSKREKQRWQDYDAEKARKKYESFSQEVLCEWLAEGLEISARMELRDRIIGIATNAAIKRKERARKYWGYNPDIAILGAEKTRRRNWSRYAPDHTPSWAKNHER